MDAAWAGAEDATVVWEVNESSDPASPRTFCRTDFLSTFCLVDSVSVCGLFPNEYHNISNMQ